MELKLMTEDNDDNYSDKLLKNVSDEVWAGFRRLAKINGVTNSKMLEILMAIVKQS